MIINILIYILVIFFLNNLILKKNFLKSSTGFDHQLFVNKSVPLTGGIVLLLPIVYFFFDNQFILINFYALMFILGLMSDLNVLTSSKKRFFLQFIIILIFVSITKLEVFPTRISLVDIYFQKSLISYLFTIFCFLVLINGANFIDGLNGLLITYIIIIFFYLFKLNLVEFIDLNSTEFFSLLILMAFVLFLNLFNHLFLGDSGAYSLSFILGFILIKIYNLNLQISPYFIILLLWYPCFENLFSIIRKSSSKLNPLDPDNDHLHQYLFVYLKKKFKFSDLLANNSSSMLINSFNFLIFFIASNNIYHTKLQLGLVILCVVAYLISYKILRNKVKSL